MNGTSYPPPLPPNYFSQVFSLAAAAAGFSVIAVEAMSVNAFALSLSLCANARSGAAARTALFPVALSRATQRCALYSRQGNALDGTLRCDPPGTEPLFSEGGMVKRQDVEVTRLDDLLGAWLPALAGRVGSLKMDTEGFEPWVVEGGARFFETVKPPYMQVEVSEAMSVDATGVGPRELLRGFANAGYTLNVITAEAAKLDLKPDEVEIKWNVDVCMWQGDAFGPQGP